MRILSKSRSCGISHKGPFTNYVYKKMGVGGQKNQLFVNRKKCKRRGVGGQKKTNLVNVVCERHPSVIHRNAQEFTVRNRST